MQIDWQALAERQGTVIRTEAGFRETGGTRIARAALIEILGDAVFRDAVDFHLSGQPGAEMARSVLQELQPAAAMERCREISRNSTDPEQAGDAINLLQYIADKRVLEWIPEFLASENSLARVWSVGTLEQLLFRGEIEMTDAMPLIEVALRDADTIVSERALLILDMAVPG